MASPQNMARSNILSKIRNQVAGNEENTARRAAVANRIANAPKGVIPERGQLSPRKRLELFCERAEAVQTTIASVESYDDIGEAVSDYLRSRNLPQALRMGQDPRLGNADWSTVPNLTREVGPTDGTDLVGLSHATTGVAETGTLVLTSGADNPTTVNFLPENHIVVIHASDIEGDYETALDRVRQMNGKGQMPRTVNMITGPSRSGDIEQTILLGAHGPRSLHIIVVDD
ncbi:MAG: lactate utilization protein [Pseudomonadota bacterium]